MDEDDATFMKFIWTILAFILMFVGMLLYADSYRHSDRYINGAFEAVKYHAITGHDPSYAWIVTAAIYVRPSGQNDDDWIRITDARAAAWQAEHVGNVAGAK